MNLIPEETAKTISKDILARQVELARKQILDAGISLTEDEARQIIEESVLESGEELRLSDFQTLIEKVFAKTRSRLGILEMYINDDSFNEIMVNGPENLFFESGGKIHRVSDAFDSVEELEEVIRNIAAAVHREINEMNPILDARLSDGSRVNAVYKNIALNGPVLTIRKFAKERITMEQMVESETLTQETMTFLKKLVKCGYNIFVSGGTSSGKTTFLNALSDFIPKGERVVVIEDSAELQMNSIENLVQMECHNANSLGQGRVSMDMLIKSSLRMRPDRIVVGEVRGKEVADMLQAMNTGHDGSMSTGHGNSIRGMLRRLEAMYLMGSQIPMDAIRAQIVEGIDIMVHLAKMADGKRKVVEIAELVGFENEKYLLNTLFQCQAGNYLFPTGKKLVHRQKMLLRGEEEYDDYLQVPEYVL